MDKYSFFTFDVIVSLIIFLVTTTVIYFTLPAFFYGIVIVTILMICVFSGIYFLRRVYEIWNDRKYFK